jgi:hypothetical protein
MAQEGRSMLTESQQTGSSRTVVRCHPTIAVLASSQDDAARGARGNGKFVYYSPLFKRARIARKKGEKYGTSPASATDIPPGPRLGDPQFGMTGAECEAIRVVAAKASLGYCADAPNEDAL